MINEASFELSDTVGVSRTTFPASKDFFDYATQFGEGDENDWEDDENDEDGQEQMDCQHQ